MSIKDVTDTVVAKIKYDLFKIYENSLLNASSFFFDSPASKSMSVKNREDLSLLIKIQQ